MQLASPPLRNYLRQHIDGIQHVHMLSWSRSFTALSEFLLWVVPSVAFVLAVSWLESFRSAEYLQAAIQQGIGPELWNVIGCFGFSLLGAALLLPRMQQLARAANFALTTAFGIGAMTYGLLIGKAIVAISAPTVQTWQAWFWGPLRQNSCRPDRILPRGRKDSMTWLDMDRLSRTERWRGCCRRRAHRWMRLQGMLGSRRERWIAG